MTDLFPMKKAQHLLGFFLHIVDRLTLRRESGKSQS
jgi:hypothetical protein